MESKIIIRMACMLTLILFTAYHVMAQKPKNAEQQKSSAQVAASSMPPTYSYKVFEAPNKMWGYDIFRDERFMFHQPAEIVAPASSAPAQNAPVQSSALSAKTFAEKAAAFAIDKIRKGQPPALTQEEIKKIISQ